MEQYYPGWMIPCFLDQSFREKRGGIRTLNSWRPRPEIWVDCCQWFWRFFQYETAMTQSCRSLKHAKSACLGFKIQLSNILKWSVPCKHLDSTLGSMSECSAWMCILDRHSRNPGLFDAIRGEQIAKFQLHWSSVSIDKVYQMMMYRVEFYHDVWKWDGNPLFNGNSTSD